VGGDNLSKFYEEKIAEYFFVVRKDIIGLVRELNLKEPLSVLEVGAGGGDTLIELKKLGIAKEVVGVDIVRLVNSYQDDPLMDNFIVGDIEKIELPYPENYFDLIICADVLEHLYDPWNAVRKLYKYLKQNGYFIASIPNIGHFSVLKKIFIDKDFRYENAGILDKTHIRFFCRKNIIDLFEANNLKVVKMISNFELNKKSKSNILSKITLGYLSDLLTVQYLVVSQKYG